MNWMRDWYFRAMHLGRGVPRAVGKHQFRLDESLRRWDFDQESQIRDCVASNCQAGGTAIDIGANFGMHTLVMAQRVGPSGQVLAVEPVPGNLRLLRRNIALNRYHDRVRVLNCAISDLAPATIEMNVDSDALEPSASIVTKKREGVSLTVANQSLDAVISTLSAMRSCFVKIDVEGAELSVLRSGMFFLNRVRPKLLIEVHDYALPDFGESSATVYEFLTSHGFEIEILSDMTAPSGKYHHILASPVTIARTDGRSR